jgi:hypothetical protein
MNNDELTYHFHLLARRVTRVEQELWPHTVVPEAEAPTGSALAEPATEGDAASVIADHSRRVPAAPLSEEWIRLTIADQERSLRERLKEAEAKLAPADACMAEICALMPREWEGNELVWCVLKLIKVKADIEEQAVARERAEILAMFYKRFVHESMESTAANLRSDGWSDTSAFLEQLHQRLTQPANRSAEECK